MGISITDKANSYSGAQFPWHKALLFFFLGLQVAFWQWTWTIHPRMVIMDNVPNESAARALSFGDPQFYFRTHAYQIQNAGWTFGRSIRLNQFDYQKLYHWFKLLDT